MNSHIVSKFYYIVVVAVGILALNIPADAQKLVTPPPDNASIEVLQEWLAEAIPKYTSYKTRSGSLTVSQVSFDGCTLKSVRSQKSGTTTSVTEGAKRTVSTFKTNAALDLRAIRSDNTSLIEHLYPELQTLQIKLRENEPVTDIVVRRSAAEAVRSALIAAGRVCSVKTS